MLTKMEVFIAVVIGFMVGAAIATAQSASQNQQGVAVSGTLTPGHCVVAGPAVGNAPNSISDAGPCPATAPPLAIGSVVAGATPGACLYVDVNGKLAQANCLTAN